MKKLLPLLLFLIPAVSFGQGSAVNNVAFKNLVTGIAPAAGATVTVCTSAGTGIPCTPLATIYSDIALTVLQTNPITADSNGYYSFFAASGTYIVTITGAGTSGRSVTYTLPFTLSGNNAFTGNNNFTGPKPSITATSENVGITNAFRWVGPSSPQFATLEAAQADCQADSTINACAIHVVSGFRETFTSTIVVGTATKSTIFYLQPDVTITCNVSAGADCFQLMPASGFVGMNIFHSGLSGGLSGGPIITVASTANAGNVITTAQGGSANGQSSLRLENILMPGSAAGTETVTNWLHIQSVNNQPVISNIFVNPSANSTGVLIDASTAAGAVMGPITLYNVFSDCQYRAGCRPGKITTGSPTANSVYNIDWNGGYLNHPGSGLPALEINGNSNASKAVSNIRIKAYFENLSNGNTIGLKIVDAWNVDWSTSGFLMQDTDTCVDISESAVNRTGSMHASTFRCQSNTGLVKVVNNHVSAYTPLTAASSQDNSMFNFGGDSGSLVAPIQIEGVLLGGHTIFFGGADLITSNPVQPGPSNTSAGWRRCDYSNTVCSGIASGTHADSITAGSVHWQSWFNGAPNNNGTNTTPDTAAVFSIGNEGSTVWKETAAPTIAGAGFDHCYGDSTAHAGKCSWNGLAFGQIDLTSNVSTTTTQVLHASATSGIGTYGAIVTADIATALTTPGPIGGTTPSTGKFTSMTATNLLWSTTAPTIAGAGCGGTVATISANNGTAAFSIFTGTAPTTACTVTMPAATTGWVCDANTVSATTTTNYIIKQTGAVSTTSVVLTLFTNAAVAQNYTASDTIRVKCSAY